MAVQAGEGDQLVADPHLRAEAALLRVADPAADVVVQRSAPPAHLAGVGAGQSHGDAHGRRPAGAVGAAEAEHRAPPRPGRRRRHEPAGGPGTAAVVPLVAAREISARVRDRNVVIGSVVVLVLLPGTLGLQVGLDSGGEETRVGVVSGDPSLAAALEAQGEALEVEVTVVGLEDERAARAAVDDEDVDGALLAGGGAAAELLVRQSAGGALQAVVQKAVSQLAVTEQLADAGTGGLEVPEVGVIALDPDADLEGQRVGVAMICVAVLCRGRTRRPRRRRYRRWW